MARLDDKTTRLGLRISTIEGSWATVHLVLTTGAFLTGYALFLGANDFELGILTSLPLLVQVFQIAGAYLLEKTGRRRIITAWGAFLGRAIWLPIALIPLFHLRGPLMVFIVFFGIGGALTNLSGPAWASWMSDLVPRKIRGRYFGARNRAVAIVTMVGGVFGGIILDLWRNSGNPYPGFLTIQLIAVIAASVAFGLILKQPEPQYAAENLPEVAEYVIRPLRDARYRKIIVFYLYWLFAVGIASPFFAAHLIKNLQWSFKSIAYLGILNPATAIICQPLWGRLVDRFKHKPVLAVSALGILFLPSFYALCPYAIRWPIYLNALLAGVFWSGFNLAIFNMVMYALPARGRPGYLASYAAWSGIMNFAASSLGGMLAHVMQSLRFEILGLTVVNYQILFMVTMFLRAPGFFLWRRLREPGAKKPALLVRHVFIAVNRRVGLGRQIDILSVNNGAGGN